MADQNLVPKHFALYMFGPRHINFVPAELNEFGKPLAMVRFVVPTKFKAFSATIDPSTPSPTKNHVEAEYMLDRMYRDPDTEACIWIYLFIGYHR